MVEYFPSLIKLLIKTYKKLNELQVGKLREIHPRHILVKLLKEKRKLLKVTRGKWHHIQGNYNIIKIYFTSETMETKGGGIIYYN